MASRENRVKEFFEKELSYLFYLWANNDPDSELSYDENELLFRKKRDEFVKKYAPKQ